MLCVARNGNNQLKPERLIMKKSQKKAVAVGASVAALAAAAAGAYFFTGKKGAKNRKAIASWANTAKREVMTEVGKMKNMSKQTYNKTVDAVMANYKTVKNVDRAELVAVANELKGHWDAIAKEVDKVRKQVVKVMPVAKKSVKRKVAVKKTTNKPVPKKATKRR